MKKLHLSIFLTIHFKEWRKIRQQYVEMPMSEEDTAKVVRYRECTKCTFYSCNRRK